MSLKLLTVSDSKEVLKKKKKKDGSNQRHTEVSLTQFPMAKAQII